MKLNSNISNYLLTICLLLAFALTAKSQELRAFPGAEGGGMYTSGGRGGKVLYVTNLSDDGKKGSLRWAATRKYPRTVVFKVSGTIELSKKLLIRSDSLTIAGQTAPGEGITLKNYPFKIDADNIIVRYLRFRMGDETAQQTDAIEGQFHKNIIIDHCSVSWSTDEAASFYGNKNFTMQWCIISESLNHSVHKKGDHGYGAIWGGKNASFHHNLLAHHNSRNPRFDHPGVYDSAEQMQEYRGNVEFVNNVIYNWHSNSSYGGEAGKFNIINNYYKAGPQSKNPERILQPYAEDEGYGSFFVSGNYLFGHPEISKSNLEGIDMSDGGEFSSIAAAIPFSVPGSLKIDKAKKAYKKVLAQAGASHQRDAVDKRIVREVETGTTTFSGKEEGIAGIIDSQSDVGGWPKLTSVEAPLDDDMDGIPDYWEIQHKLNPNDPADSQQLDKSGYTMLETYLNQLINNSNND
ncbi:pectate lyase [Mangrovibacterium lignilyticum]|uniref:pectate lyase n=1 Tax=Mangrovibacterium lignilyticum TaxID=2668052 RepID=UPI001EE4F93D|nr:pectate lyase [Mangrovibacterium lignilyticum]